MTEVVTAFLWHAGRVCLFKRSAAVRTYRGRYAGISGYLEGRPLQHVQVEIREETGLEPGDYRLVRQGQALHISDQGYDWVVHPFLCEVFTPDKITLDWENLELIWIEPGRIKELPTVPSLWEAYRRASRLPLEETLAAFEAEMLANRHSGSRQLAREALLFLQRLARDSNAAEGQTLRQDLAWACDRLATARPSMVMIATALALVRQDLLAQPDAGIAPARQAALDLIDDHLQALQAALLRAAAHLPELVPPGATVLVHSYSSTLEAALPSLQQRGCRLVVTESRPGLEGRQTARLAAAAGLAVRLVTDAAAAYELERADLVLMGLDALETDGAVINKTGSALIARAAHTLGVPVYFIGECRKIAATGVLVELEHQAARDVWDAPPAGVEVSNPTFERVAPAFIRGIVLEEGLVAPERVAKLGPAED